MGNFYTLASMKIQTAKDVNMSPATMKGRTTGISYTLILLAYVFAAVLTPDLGCLDSNGPKFLALSILNILSFVYLLTRKDLKSESQLYWVFFKNKAGLAFTLFMAMMLVSFSKAINLPESLLTFGKFFTVFAAAYIVSIVLSLNKKYVLLLSIAATVMLLVDCVTIFYNILLYIAGQIDSIYEIKSVYSNKNILTSSVFVKIPFALWLASFEKGWYRSLGIFSLFMAVLAVLFMSTRSFYLGLLLLAVIYGAYLMLSSQGLQPAKRFKMIALFLGLTGAAYLAFTVTQTFLFPKNTDAYNQGFTKRIATSFSGETSASLRLETWKRSAILFKKDPLLGVGAGNWKVQVLQYENPGRSDFNYMIRNHNDFIEMAVETGILGGLLYLAIFVLIVMNFVIAFFKPGAGKETYQYLFLPAFGVICYSVDAFFNFPADRPEIQSLLALYLGLGIAYTPASAKVGHLFSVTGTRILAACMMLILLATTYVLFLNFKSLRLQSIIFNEVRSGDFRHTSDKFCKEFPFVPDIAIDGEPIQASKSRYLIQEGKYREAIDLLKAYQYSPYDAHCEISLAMAYAKLGKEDSALLYAYQAYRQKPRYYPTLSYICKSLEKSGKPERAITMLSDFVNIEKLSPEAWVSLAAMYRSSGNFQAAIKTIDSAVVYLPADTMLANEKQLLDTEVRSFPYKESYANAMSYYKAGNYPMALKYLNEIMQKENGLGAVCSLRAICNYFCQDYQTCIKDVDRCVVLKHDTPDLICLRGICYHKLGNIEAACRDFQDAKAKGNKDAIANVEKFCK